MLGHNIGGPAAHQQPLLSTGLRPPDPLSLISLNMSLVGHDTCSMIIVQACTMIIVYVSCPTELMLREIVAWGSRGWTLLRGAGESGGLRDVSGQLARSVADICVRMHLMMAIDPF